MYDISISLSWLYGIPILLILQTAMTYGLSLFIASVNLFFRDLQRLVTILVTFLFFLTPIIYNHEMVPENYRYLVALNPVAPLMTSWRSLFLTGQLDPQALILTLVYSVAIFFFGRFIYNRLVNKFAEVI